MRPEQRRSFKTNCEQRVTIGIFADRSDDEQCACFGGLVATVDYVNIATLNIPLQAS